MTVESILEGAGRFAQSLISIITGNLTPATIEGLTFLFLLGIVIRVIDVGPKIPGKIAERVRKEDDEWEYVMVRRKK